MCILLFFPVVFFVVVFSFHIFSFFSCRVFLNSVISALLGIFLVVIIATYVFIEFFLDPSKLRSDKHFEQGRVLMCSDLTQQQKKTLAVI